MESCSDLFHTFGHGFFRCPISHFHLVNRSKICEEIEGFVGRPSIAHYLSRRWRDYRPSEILSVCPIYTLPPWLTPTDQLPPSPRFRWTRWRTSRFPQGSPSTIISWAGFLSFNHLWGKILEKPAAQAGGGYGEQFGPVSGIRLLIFTAAVFFYLSVPEFWKAREKIECKLCNSKI